MVREDTNQGMWVIGLWGHEPKCREEINGSWRHEPRRKVGNWGKEEKRDLFIVIICGNLCVILYNVFI